MAVAKLKKGDANASTTKSTTTSNMDGDSVSNTDSIDNDVQDLQDAAPDSSSLPITNTEITDKYIDPSTWIKTNAVDAAANPMDTLMPQVSGYRWTVDFFQHVQDKDDVADLNAVGVLAPYQQYNEIKDVVVRLQGELTSDIDEVTKETTVTGEFIIANSMVPNRGDAFIVAMDTGVYGLFSVTNTKRLSIYKGTGYNVEFVLIAHAAVDDAEFIDLNSKVVNTYYYDERQLGFGSKQILSTNDVNIIKEMKAHMSILEDEYLREFVSPRICSLVLKEDSVLIYDDAVTEYVRKTFAAGYSVIRSYSPKDLGTYKRSAQTIYDMMMMRLGHRSSQMIATVRASVVQRQRDLPFLYSLHNTPVTHIMTNTEQLNGSIIDESWNKDYLGDDMFVDKANVSLKSIITVNEVTIESDVTPIIHPVGVTDHLVLSENWYKQTDSMSLLELMVDHYLAGHSTDVPSLKVMIDSMTNFNKVERFYLTPLIVNLIKAVEV